MAKPNGYFNNLMVYGALNSCSFNVLGFGATGNGVTDDTLALQAAINAAGGEGEVVIPETANSFLTGPLTIPANTIVRLDGELFLKANSNTTNTAVLTCSGSGITIYGKGSISGNSVNQTLSGLCAGISAQSQSNINIRGITVTLCKNWPINFIGCTYSSLSYLTLTNSGNAVEFANACVACTADHLTISGITDQGFSFYGGPTYCSITNSTVANCSSAGIGVWSDAGQPAGCTDIIIANNMSAYNSGTAWGCWIAEPGAYGALTNIIVKGNIFTNNPAGGILQNAGKYVTISDNVIASNGNQAGAAGISLLAGYCTVTGNFIHNEGQGGTSGIGILMAASAQNIVLTGNMMLDDQGTPTMLHGIGGTAGANCSSVGNFAHGMIGAANSSGLAPSLGI